MIAGQSNYHISTRQISDISCVALEVLRALRAFKFVINFEQKGHTGTAFQPINTGQTPMSQSVYNYHSEGKHQQIQNSKTN